MSECTFLRRFAEATGQTPGAWLAAVRTEEARRLLETTSHPVEAVARYTGFGNAAALRHHFARATGLAPREYRERFRAVGDGRGRISSAASHDALPESPAPPQSVRAQVVSGSA